MFRINAKAALKSKGIIGGLVVVALGIYMVYKSEYELGMLAVGNGLALLGIRDAQETPKD